MSTKGASFLYNFAIGNYDAGNPGSNIISVTSTASGDFSKTYLTSTPLRQRWRSTSTSTQSIVIQANDTSIVPDTMAILGHNFSSEAVVKVFASNSLVFSSTPLFTFTWNKKHLIYNNDFGSAYNYYKITVQDAGNIDGFIEIGKIVGGLSLTMINNEDMSDDFSNAPVDYAYAMQTEGFSRASNERVTTDVLSITIKQLSTRVNTDNYINLRTMIDVVRTTLPLLMIIDPTDVYFQFIWGQFNQGLPSWSYAVNRYADLSMVIEEVY